MQIFLSVVLINFFVMFWYSYERHYRGLLDHMIQNDLALKGVFDGVELLIFPSNQLPESSQRKESFYAFAKQINTLNNFWVDGFDFGDCDSICLDSVHGFVKISQLQIWYILRKNGLRFHSYKEWHASMLVNVLEKDNLRFHSY